MPLLFLSPSFNVVTREAFEELAMRLEILEHEREEKAAMARCKHKLNMELNYERF